MCVGVGMGGVRMGVDSIDMCVLLHAVTEFFKSYFFLAYFSLDVLFLSGRCLFVFLCV